MRLRVLWKYWSRDAKGTRLFWCCRNAEPGSGDSSLLLLRIYQLSPFVLFCLYRKATNWNWCDGQALFPFLPCINLLFSASFEISVATSCCVFFWNRWRRGNWIRSVCSMPIFDVPSKLVWFEQPLSPGIICSKTKGLLFSLFLIRTLWTANTAPFVFWQGNKLLISGSALGPQYQFRGSNSTCLMELALLCLLLFFDEYRSKKGV